MILSLFDYSRRVSSSAFHAGSTMHKNFKSLSPEFSMNCLEFGGTYAESSFSVAENNLSQLTAQLEAAGCNAFHIGRVVEDHPGKLTIK